MNSTSKPVILLLVLTLCTAAPCIRADEDTRPAYARVTSEEMPGNWLALHPEWRGNIVFYPDGTFVRPHIGGGRWTVNNEGGECSVVLRWNSWGAETLGVWSSDQLRGKQRYGTFRLYRVPHAPPKELPQDPNPAGNEATKASLDDSSWELIDHKRFTLHSDGSISSKFDERTGTWEVIAPNTLKISVPWEPAPAKIVTTNAEAKILRWTDDETNLAVREGA